MRLVIDASVVVAALSPDEADDHAIDVIAASKTGSRFAPRIWPAEIANVLIGKVQKSAMSTTTAHDIWRLANSLNPMLEDVTADQMSTHVFPLALRHRLTIYDTLYLYAAIACDAALATYDKALIKAAKAEGVEVL